jgi:hypothetical protein
MLRRMLIRYRLARRAGRSILDSLLALFIRKPPSEKQTDDENRARLMELKKRWDEER